jgi:hypothetical protein
MLPLRPQFHYAASKLDRCFFYGTARLLSHELLWQLISKSEKLIADWQKLIDDRRQKRLSAFLRA